MHRLLIRNMHEIRRERSLHNLHEETIRKRARAPAVQRSRAVAPFFGDGEVVAAVDLDAGFVRPGVCELEAGGVDEAVEGVGVAVGDYAGGDDAVYAEAFCVDEGYVGPVKGVQIGVVEAGSFWVSVSVWHDW